MTVPGHLATPLTDGKTDPWQRVLYGVAMSPPSPPLLPYSRACGLTVSQAGGSQAEWVNSISSAAVSSESLSGLGFLSMTHLCSVIVQMTWLPTAGLMKGGHLFSVASGEVLVSPVMLKASSDWGRLWAPPSSFLSPRDPLFFC